MRTIPARLLSVLLFILVVALVFLSLPASAELEPVLLSSDSGSHGYKGADTTIAFSFSYGGKTFTVNVYVSGADAYDAAALALLGVYDTDLHEWTGFGVFDRYTAKDWYGPGLWESYHFTLTSEQVHGPLKTYFSYGVMEVTGSANIVYEVTHCTWWGVLCSSWEDVYVLTADAIVRNGFI